MVASTAFTSRPNRQDIMSPAYYSTHPYNSFGIPLLYSHASEESETGGGGGPYGQPATPGMTDSYAAPPAPSGGPYLPQPQRDHQRSSRGHRLGTDQVHDNFDFSALPTGQPIGYQQPMYAPPHGRQPQGPQLYYGSDNQYIHNQPRDHGRGGVAPEILSGPSAMHRRGGSRESTTLPDPRYGGHHPGLEIPPQRGIYSSQGRSAPYPSSPAHSAGSLSPHIRSESPRSMSQGLPGGDASNHQAMDEWLRENAGIRPGDPINLWSLPDPPTPTTRPNVTYKVLVSLAIYGSPAGRLSLQDIYNEIETRFPYYRNLPEEMGRDGKSGGKKWQRSVRHNLSLESIFVNENRNINEPGKGGYWSVTNVNGYGQKRERKRKGKSSSSTSSRDSHSARDEDDMDEDEDDDLSEDLQVGPSSGARRSGRTSRHGTHSNAAFPVLPGNTIMPYDSVPSFGQTSFGPQPSRNRPPRTSSMPQLPNMMNDPQAQHDVRPNPTRPSTVPLYGHDYEPMATPEQQYRFAGQPGYSFGAEGESEGLRRSSRDKTKHRGQ